MKSLLRLTALCLILFAQSGCWNPTYLKPLTETSQVSEKNVVLLLVVKGARANDHVQIWHSQMPCMDFGLSASRYAVVAFSIPIGLKQVQPVCFTAGGHTDNGIPGGRGYNNVPASPYRKVYGRERPIDLPVAGVYFLGVMDNVRAGDDSNLQPPSEDDIKLAKAKYGALLGNSPTLNFKW